MKNRIVTSGRLIAALLGIAACYFAGAVFVPVLCALYAAVALDPWVMKLTSRGMSRWFATGLTLLLFAVGVSATLSITYNAIAQTVAKSPTYLPQLEQWKVKLLHQEPTESKATVLGADPRPSSPLPTWQDLAMRLAGSMFEFISLALFVPLLIFYLLTDKEDLIESYQSLAGKIFYVPKLNVEVPAMVRAFCRGNVYGWALLASAHFLLFTALGIKHAGNLAFVAGFLNLIPILGAPMAFLLPATHGLAQWTELWPFLLLGLGTLSLHFVVGNIFLPHLIGPRINVNAAALVIGLIFWGWMWGAMGLLLALPLTATVKILLDSNLQTRPVANLLADRPRHILGISVGGSRTPSPKKAAPLSQ